MQLTFQALETTTERKTAFNSKLFKKEKSYNTNWNVCKYCKESHVICMCVKFKNLTISERTRTVKEKRICSNCLNHCNNETCSSAIIRKNQQFSSGTRTTITIKTLLSEVDQRRNTIISSCMENLSVLIAPGITKKSLEYWESLNEKGDSTLNISKWKN